ncbi:MAG: 50S ribosomal protein L17 [Balneola sp.]
MRHRVKGRKLSRTAAHRKATMRALSMALIREHRITTTVAKAKELRGFVEPLITRAKVDSHHNRKQVFSSLQNNDAVTQLFTEIGPKVGDRPGGYTRVIKTGYRQGDAAEMAIIELVDFNDLAPEDAKSTKKKRTRRAGKSNTPTTSTEESSESKEEVSSKTEEVKDSEESSSSEEKK